MSKTQTQYDALVVTSGGVKGFIILGALDYLYEKGLLNSIKTYAGCSVGSLITYLLIIGYTPKEIFTYVCSNNILSFLSNINFLSIPDHYGLINIDNLQEYMEKMTYDKVGYIPTFSDLHNKFGKFFMCPAYNLNTENPVVYFSHLTHPDMNVVKAVCMSSTIPLVFTKSKYKNEHYIDGAFFDHFPIYKTIEMTNSKSYLGIKFEDKEEKTTQINSFYDYIKNIFKIKKNNYYTEDEALLNSVAHDIITLKTETSALNFSVEPTEKIKMFLSGKDYVKKHFNP